MNVFRKWYLLQKAFWAQTVAGLLYILVLLITVPGGWTNEERQAAKRGYLAGIAFRLGDVYFWKRALVSVAGIAVLVAVVRLLIYYFVLWAYSRWPKNE
jgi:hypothetical protein